MEQGYPPGLSGTRYSATQRPRKGRFTEDTLWNCKNGHLYSRKNDHRCPECRCELDIIPPRVPDNMKCPSWNSKTRQWEEATGLAASQNVAQAKSVKSVRAPTWGRGREEPIMEDGRNFGLLHCPNGHYFHFSYGTCNFCGEPAEDDEAFGNAITFHPAKENLEDMAAFGLLKCKNGHLYQSEWEFCNECGEGEGSPPDSVRRSPEEPEKKYFNPFKDAREAQLAAFKTIPCGYQATPVEQRHHGGGRQRRQQEARAQAERQRMLFQRANNGSRRDDPRHRSTNHSLTSDLAVTHHSH